MLVPCPKYGTDQKLCKRNKEEGRAEVYSKHILSSLPFSRRLSVMTYFAWIVIEGFILVFARSSTSTEYHYSRLEAPLIYFVASSFLLLLLHSYLGGRIANYVLRSTIFVHQILLVAFSLRNIALENQTGIRPWPGFRVAVMACCGIADMAAVFGQLRSYLGKIVKTTDDSFEALFLQPNRNTRNT
jgi:hypothetical protein